MRTHPHQKSSVDSPNVLSHEQEKTFFLNTDINNSPKNPEKWENTKL